MVIPILYCTRRQVGRNIVVDGYHVFLINLRTYAYLDKPPSVEQPRSEYPTMVTQKSGKKVPVVQAYAYCKYLGKLMVDFDDEGNVLAATGNPQILDSAVQKGKKNQFDNSFSK